jgi:hypothetical protein
LIAQKAAAKEQADDANNIAQAARHALRVGFEKVTEPNELTGEASASTGFGSAA